MNIQRFSRGIVYWVGALLIVLNILVSGLHITWDITDHKNFTLTQATKTLLTEVEEPVTIDILFDGNIKATDKKFARAIQEILIEFQSYTKQPISFTFRDPFYGIKTDSVRFYFLDSLSHIGIKPYTLRSQNESLFEEKQNLILPSAVVSMGKRKRVVNFFDGVSVTSEEELFARSEALLEYQFASAIEQMQQKKAKKVYFSSANREPMDARMIDFFRTIASHYDIDTLNLTTSYVPKDADMLFVFFPTTSFTEEEKIKIDHYVMHGGKVVFVMSSIGIENSKSTTSGNLLFFNQSQNMEDLLFQYGCRVESALVKDLQCAPMSVVVGNVGNKPQINTVNWPYYAILNPNPASVITKNMDPVLSKYTTWIDTLTASTLQKTVLLSSSEKSQTVATPCYVSISEAKEMDPILFTKKRLPIAVLIEGNFTSLYHRRLVQQEKDAIKNATGQEVLPVSSTTSIVVISNPQLFINEIGREGIIPMGYAKDMQFSFANKSFLLNVVSYMCNPNGVIAARKKDFVLQLLNTEKVKSESTFWRIFNIGVPIIALLLLAIAIQFVRYKRR